MNIAVGFLAELTKLGYVVAHIGGPSGSGKTTLLSKIRTVNAKLVPVDLDQFDDAATAALYPGVRKRDYTPGMIKTLAQRRQQLLDSFLQKNKKQAIVLAGHHTEGDTALSIPTTRRYLLNTSPLRSAWRGYRRSQSEQKDHRRRLLDLPADYREARETITDLKARGYTPMSAEQILRSLR